MSRKRRLIVKIGSQALCDSEGLLQPTVLTSLARQIAGLHEQDWDVLLVSSGAVAAGLGVAGMAAKRVSNPVAARQVLAAAGQVQLMEQWQRAFHEHRLQTAQVLLSKGDFQSRQHYLNTRACLEGILQAGLVPIINENDVVAVTELMFTDNDELAGLLAGMVDAELLALLSTVPGVLDPVSGKPISSWDGDQHQIDAVVRSGTSRLGRGGMHSKLNVARRAAGLGTEVVIADGRAADVLPQLAAGEALGTRFPASQKLPPTKRWLASMHGHTLGAVTINDGARDALLDPRRLASLLPVGVTALEGDFHAGDVIEVRDAGGVLLGCGRTAYDADKARDALGQHEQKPLIHYDYLYIID